MKHERNIKPEKRQNWRLKKTLSRRIEVRGIEADDLKYLWATYKLAGLPQIGEVFADKSMKADAFQSAFEEAAAQFSEAWTILAETKRGYIPAGVMFGNVAPMGAYMIVTGAVWFPWSTSRNVIEGTVAFLNMIRKRMPSMFYALDEHKRLYEVVCMHSILRRVGTSHIVFPGRSAAVFETKA